MLCKNAELLMDPRLRGDDVKEETIMFTGIVDHIGTVQNIQTQEHSIRAWIKTNFTDLTLGESIAVDGVCLTVTDFKAGNFACDISPETLSLTTLGTRQEDSHVNLERALLPSSRLGGHFVTGHVDGCASLASMEKTGEYLECVFEKVRADLQKFLVHKGCITVNGVSLTVNNVADDSFSVMLIPHTLERTNLSELQISDKVNLETDYLARFVLKDVRK